MKFIHLVIAACVALLLSAVSFASSPANAAGLQRAPAANISADLVIKARGCHRRVRGNRRPHVHRGRNCRRVDVRRGRNRGVRRGHCHRDARRHGTRLHRHVGRRCARRNLRRSDRRRNNNCVRIGPVYFCD